MTEIAVVLLNWNGRDFLKKYLPSVIEHSTTANTEVIVVDNNSSDDSIEVLRDDFPKVKVIQLDKNYGFAGGYAKGLKEIRSKYFVLLNTDVEVTQNWLGPLYNFLEDNLDVGACQPKLKAYYNKAYFEYSGAAGGFLDKYGYPFCRGRIFNTLEEDKGQYESQSEIFWASGACLFIRSDVYFEAGGLDDRFFAHMEEIDLCWRINNLGYKIFYLPQSTVYHVGGGTLPKENPYKTYLNFRNSLYNLYKNTPKSQFKKIFIGKILLDMLALIKYCLTFSFQFCFSILRGYKDFVKIRKELSKERQQEMVSNTLLYQKSIAVDYFFRSKKKFTDLDFWQDGLGNPDRSIP